MSNSLPGEEGWGSAVLRSREVCAKALRISEHPFMVSMEDGAGPEYWSVR